MSVSTPATADPSRILDIATGYMGAQQLFAASRIGLFAALAEGERKVADLAKTTGVSERMARILADAMAGLGLLTRRDGSYALTPSSAAYLTGGKAQLDLAPFLTFLAEISYPHWLQFPRTVDTDQPGDLGMTEARWATFMAGVMTYNKLHADMFVGALDFSASRKALDLGGLAPNFAMRAMEANPNLRTTFVYAPDFIESVRQAVSDAGLADRVELIGAATETAEPKGEFDLVFVNHVVHRFTVEQNRAIFRHARAAAVPGARLAVLDFYLDDNAEQRAIDALHAAEYLVIDGTVVFPEAEVRSWLVDAGWRPLETVALPGSPRVLLAEAV